MLTVVKMVDPKLLPTNLKLGDYLECVDTQSKLLPAKVIGVREYDVHIHWPGWDQKWDEWIPRSSHRLVYVLLTLSRI